MAVHSALLQKPQLLGPDARKTHAGRQEMKDQLVGSESRSNRKKGH